MVEVKKINSVSECVIRIFMMCMFNRDFSVIDEQTFDRIHTEYIDLSGIGMTKQFELILSIHNLNARITEIEETILLHRNSVSVLGMPFIPALDSLAKFGYRLSWSGDIEQFFKSLDSIDIQERVQHVYLADEKKKLNSLETVGVKNDQDSRKDFIKTLNRLGKEGFKINKDETTMEELALMILDYNEESTAKMSK